MVKVKDVVECMDVLAPQHLKESWDNVGLQMGHPDDNVAVVLVALTPTQDVIEEAVAEKADMLITHHPLIFKGPLTLRQDDPLGALVYELNKANMAFFCAHTNLDVAEHGVNDALGQKLGLENMRFLVETSSAPYYKLATYVPLAHFEEVQRSLFAAGAGRQGDYECCGWSCQGTGSFLPKEGSKPYLGQVGEVFLAEEQKLEVLVKAEDLSKVVEALLTSHPYEEVAYDLFKEEHLKTSYGIGRIGELAEPTSLANCLARWQENLDVERLNYTGDLGRMVKKVAFCGGSATSYLSEASAQQADVYLTGDVRYHDAQRAQEMGIALVDAGHYGTEKHALTYLQGYLQENFPEIKVIVSNVEEDFIKSY